MDVPGGQDQKDPHTMPCKRAPEGVRLCLGGRGMACGSHQLGCSVLSASVRWSRQLLRTPQAAGPDLGSHTLCSSVVIPSLLAGKLQPRPPSKQGA